MKALQNKQLTLEEIKNIIKQKVGNTICINQINKQGKKLNETIGTIISSYENFFLVKVEINKFSVNKTFSYIDFLTNDFVFTVN